MPQSVITHEFTYGDDYSIVDGQVVPGESLTEKCTFVMTHASHAVFEELFGQPFLAFMTKNIDLDEVQLGDNKTAGYEDLLATLLLTDVIGCLAAATWVDVESGLGHQTIESALKFKEKPFYATVKNDLDFVSAFMQTCVIDCLPSVEAKSKTSSKKARGL